MNIPAVDGNLSGVNKIRDCALWYCPSLPGAEKFISLIDRLGRYPCKQYLKIFVPKVAGVEVGQARRRQQSTPLGSKRRDFGATFAALEKSTSAFRLLSGQHLNSRLVTETTFITGLEERVRLLIGEEWVSISHSSSLSTCPAITDK